MSDLTATFGSDGFVAERHAANSFTSIWPKPGPSLSHEHDRALSALQHLSPSRPHDEWVRLGMAAHAAGLAFEEWDNWSAGGDGYEQVSSRNAWKSFRPDGGINAATLFHLARAEGWFEDVGYNAPIRPLRAPTMPLGPPRPLRPGMSTAEVWNRCKAATAEHGYIVAKGGKPDGLRVVPMNDPLRIAELSMAGALVVPVIPLNSSSGEPVSLQFIAGPQQAVVWTDAGKPSKLNLPGASMAGVFVVGKLGGGEPVLIVEGIGQAWATEQASTYASVVCFGAGRMRCVATELRKLDPVARLVLVPDAGKEAQAQAIAADVGCEFVLMPTGSPSNFDAHDYAAEHGMDALDALIGTAQTPPKSDEPERPGPAFTVVPFADIESTEPPPPAYAWEGFIPAGFVTLLAAHGGVGKSMIALMLAISVALGLPLFGIPTRRGNAVLFSGEDGAALLRHRLKLLCRELSVSVKDLDGRLFMLDATDDDPTLFTEISIGGRRDGIPTLTYNDLREFAAMNDIKLLIVDNASDAFDANEIDRARVRGFMRSLARIARERDAGVLLLAHVDKGTSRGERTDTESYSGSTAWHNSARSRLSMKQDGGGILTLTHQKNNLGKKCEPLQLVWPDGGIPQAVESIGPSAQAASQSVETIALLKLIAEFTNRREFITTAITSRTHAAKLLHREPGYPKLRDTEVFALLRQAERTGQLERVLFKGNDRHYRERWNVTESGADYAGITAATAGTAVTREVTALSAETAEPLATAATSLLGGVGETAPHGTPSAADMGTPELDQRSLQDQVCDAIQIAWQAGCPLNRAGLKAKIKRRKADVIDTIEDLLSDFRLIEVQVPSKERALPTKSAFLVSLTEDERAAVIRGDGVPKDKEAVPASWKKPTAPQQVLPGKPLKRNHPAGRSSKKK